MTENYSEIVERLRKYTLPGTNMRFVVAEEAAAAIAALQLKLADAQASAEASALRVVRAEAVVEAARGINTFAWASMTADCNEARDEGNRRLAALKDTTAALDRLDQQEDRHD